MHLAFARNVVHMQQEFDTSKYKVVCLAETCLLVSRKCFETHCVIVSLLTSCVYAF